jgi:hypothetical protein
VDVVRPNLVEFVVDLGLYFAHSMYGSVMPKSMVRAKADLHLYNL